MYVILTFYFYRTFVKLILHLLYTWYFVYTEWYICMTLVTGCRDPRPLARYGRKAILVETLNSATRTPQGIGNLHSVWYASMACYIV